MKASHIKTEIVNMRKNWKSTIYGNTDETGNRISECNKLDRVGKVFPWELCKKF